jgi:hypothetical protein
MAAGMSWKRRILELTLAGGLLAGAAGCDDGPHIPLCNANPDPCCADPNSQACYDYQHRDLSVPADMVTPRDLTPSSD